VISKLWICFVTGCVSACRDRRYQMEPLPSKPHLNERIVNPDTYRAVYQINLSKKHYSSLTSSFSPLSSALLREYDELAPSATPPQPKQPNSTVPSRKTLLPFVPCSTSRRLDTPSTHLPQNNSNTKHNTARVLPRYHQMPASSSDLRAEP
jgi:hypothetical protein